MIISPQSLDTNLSQLLAEVKSGSMQLPEFQRDWTWDDNRIRGIIASLSQGYPMGAIMRLQYGNPDIQFKYRTITGVKGVSVKPEHLILDGQQRLTSIYQATSSKEPVLTKTEKGKAMAGCTCYAAAGTLPLSPEDHQFLQSEVLPRTADRYDKRP